MLPDHTTSAGMESSDKKDLERLSISAVVPVMNRHTNHETTSSQAQSAAPLQLGFEDLTEHEQLLVATLAIDGRPVKTLHEIMEDCHWNRGRGGHAKGYSRVRNTLRRLVRAQWVIHETEIGDGRYRLSVQALNRLRLLVDDMAKQVKPRAIVVERRA